MCGNAEELQVRKLLHFLGKSNYLGRRNAKTVEIHIYNNRIEKCNAFFFRSSFQHTSYIQMVNADDNVRLMGKDSKTADVFGIGRGIGIHDFSCTSFHSHFAFVYGAAQKAFCTQFHLFL